VWFRDKKDLLRPIVWQIQWPADVTSPVVSVTNPTGQIINLDLEMASVLLHKVALEAATLLEMQR
jgi:hypothetical protein